MRSFVVDLIKFFLFAFLFYIFFICCYGFFTPQIFKSNNIYNTNTLSNTYVRLKEIKQLKGEIDYLFLGSSHTYRGFDPRNFRNHKCFNLGTSSQTPLQTEILLDRYLDKIKPKTIIYEVYPATFSSDGVESALDIMANDKNDILSLKMALEINDIRVYNSLFYIIFRNFIKQNNVYFEQNTQDEKYHNGGFVERKMEYFRHVNYSSKTWDLKKNQLSKFKNLVEKLKKRNIKLILVYAPITKSLYQSYTNNNDFDRLMRETKLEYYNFNRLMQLDDSLHFYDSHHLNQDGVNIFNKQLLHLIE